jgi:AcrR family transcriptional regulator
LQAEEAQVQKKGRRRRGGILEGAILDAAWGELLDHGYTRFTIDAVAKRANTSRPVLNRRWHTRAELAVAAIGNYNKNNPIEVPDLGNVRTELILLLQKLVDRGARTMTKVVLTMNDYFKETNSSIEDLRQIMVCKDEFQEVLERGFARGELDRSRMTPRIASLPLDLIRHEVIMTRKAVSSTVIVEIVDKIFLPLAAAEAEADGHRVLDS